VADQVGDEDVEGVVPEDPFDLIPKPPCALQPLGGVV
jgi:hypothetical protein